MSISCDIRNKNVLITGANRGIGKSILENFLQQGAKKVYAAVRDPDSVQPLVEKYPGKVIPLAMDVADERSVAAAAEQAGDVEIVVSNAGILFNARPLQNDAIDRLQQEMDVNVYGLMRLARAFAPVLKANGGGALVQLNSVASLLCFPQFTTYSASKAAAFSVTQGLQEQLAEQNTLVVSVHPGPIATDMASNAGFGDIAEPASQVAEAIISALQEGRFLVYTDSMAHAVGEAFQPFADQYMPD